LSTDNLNLLTAIRKVWKAGNGLKQKWLTQHSLRKFWKAKIPHKKIMNVIHFCVDLVQSGHHHHFLEK
jgi:hypothetical protein